MSVYHPASSIQWSIFVMYIDVNRCTYTVTAYTLVCMLILNSTMVPSAFRITYFEMASCLHVMFSMLISLPARVSPRAEGLGAPHCGSRDWHSLVCPRVTMLITTVVGGNKRTVLRPPPPPPHTVVQTNDWLFRGIETRTRYLKINHRSFL